MLKPVLYAAGLFAAAVVSCGVLIGIGASIGHREGPMLITLLLELTVWGASALMVFQLGRRAAPAGAARWVLTLAYLGAGLVAMVPLGVATALAFDH